MSFLARFATVLLVVVIAISAALSYAFSRSHLEALKSDLITNAAGQASATLQPALDKYAHSGEFTESDRARIDMAVRSVQNFQPLVRGVRLYRPDGAPLDPILSPDATAEVKRAIDQQNFVQASEVDRAGEPLVTVFVPLAAPTGRSYLAVAAIEVSVGQLTAQTAGESRFVVGATVAACLLLFLSLLTLAIAAQRELNKRKRQADTTFLQTMEGIAAIVDQRDPYTADHSLRVSEYSVLIATELRLSRAEIDRVRWSALLHDLGKIGIPDVVLLKAGPLDPHEREVISAHPTIAAGILGQVEALAEITPCVLHHHERYDGNGYPKGLAGESIPLLSRIIAVADTFDAMTTDRPYRKGLDIAETRRRIIEGSNVQWDARIVKVAVTLIDAGRMAPPAKQSSVFGQRLGLSGERPA